MIATGNGYEYGYTYSPDEEDDENAQNFGWGYAFGISFGSWGTRASGFGTGTSLIRPYIAFGQGFSSGLGRGQGRAGLGFYRASLDSDDVLYFGDRDTVWRRL